MMRRRLSDRLSVQVKLAAAFGLVAALAVAVPAAVQALAATQRIADAAHTANLRTADAAATLVDDHVDHALIYLIGVAGDAGLVQGIHADDSAGLVARLERDARTNPHFVDLAVRDVQGRVRASWPRERPASASDHQLAPHDVQALYTDEPAVGLARPNPTGTPVVPLAVPVRGPDGRAVGVLTGTLSLEALAGRLDDIGVGERGDVSLVDDKGTILTGPDRGTVLRAAGGMNPVAQRALNGTPTAQEMRSSTGVPVFAAAVQVEGLPLIAYVAHPADEAYGPHREALRTAMLVAVLAFVAATALGIGVSGQITGPLVALRRRSAEVAVRHGAPLAEGARDEIRALAVTVDEMAVRLDGAVLAAHERADDAEAQRALARAVLDAVDDAVLFFDPQLRLALANGRLPEVLDLPMDRVGRAAPALRHDIRRAFADPKALMRFVHTTAANPDVARTGAFETRGEPRRELKAFAAPVRGPGGRLRGQIYVFRDATRELEVDRMKTEFVSLVSHELRTPMTSIKGYTDLILDGEAGDVGEEQREFLGIIQNNVDRLVALINDLLDVSRIEAGKVELQRVQVDLRTVVRAAAAAVRPQVDGKRQQLTFELPEEPVVVSGDANRLTQVFTNLISNAHKYTPAGGAIAVALSGGDGQAQVEVRDTGVGMSPTELARLFTKFYRASNRATKQAGGTGLGLVITKSLVELHDGEIAVDSTPGRGTTFTVTLPTVQVRTDPGETPVHATGSAAPTVAARPRVLVVEDDPDIAALMRRYLERGGYEPTIAPTGESALKAACGDPPDLILLDVLLPTIDGLQVLEQLKAEPTTAAVPVVMVSILPDDGRSADAGAVAYLVKPVDERRLLAFVHAVLADHQPGLVLVTDHDADIRAMVTAHLRRVGYAVDEAADGLAALRRLRADPATRDLPVVMMTGTPATAEQTKEAIEELGAAALLARPIRPEELAASLSEALQRRTAG